MRRSEFLIIGAFCASAVLVASCGSSGRKRTAPEEVMTPTAELDIDRREVVEAFRAGGAEWVEMRERVRDDETLAGFVVDNMIDQMLRSYDLSQVARTGERTGPFERAQSELIELGEHAAPVLAEFLDADLARDTVAGFLAADVLLRIGELSLGPVASKLDSDNSETRRRTIELLGRLAPTVTRVPEHSTVHSGAEILTVLGELALRDSDWIVRGEAARAVGARGAYAKNRKSARETLAKVLNDADPSVRGVAAQALGELGDPRGMPLLTSYIDAEVQEGEFANVAHAQESLVRLARDRFEGQEPKRFTTADWRSYWHRERERLLTAEKR